MAAYTLYKRRYYGLKKTAPDPVKGQELFSVDRFPFADISECRDRSVSIGV